MKTIIVATDFSHSALNAIDYAALLAAQTNAKLFLFHAFQLPLHASNTLISASGINQMLQLSKQQLEKIAQQKSQQLSIEAEAITKSTYLTEGLDELVYEVSADLVVLGMHQNDWGDRLFGNTTLSIMRNSNYPVLIVPEKITFKKIEKILYAYNPACISGGKKLLLLRELAQKLGASVQVFHVEATAEEPEVLNAIPRDNNVETALDNINHDYRDVYQKDIVKGIEEGIVDYGADLLVTVPHRLELWKRLTKNSVTRQLAIEAPLPLLVLSTEELN